MWRASAGGERKSAGGKRKSMGEQVRREMTAGGRGRERRGRRGGGEERGEVKIGADKARQAAVGAAAFGAEGRKGT